MKGKVSGLLAGVAALALAAAARADAIDLTAAKMVDPASGSVITTAAVIIKDDRILQVGNASSLAAPGDARRIDLGTEKTWP